MAIKPDDKKADRSAVLVKVRDGEEHPDDALARMLTRPEVQAAAAIQKLDGSHETNAVLRELERQVAAVQSGDLRRGEAMLVTQAHALDQLFCNMMRRAEASNGYRDTIATYLKLAFKAQAQCRANWQALAEMKNPRPVAVFNQANISNGPQQVNNGPAPSGVAGTQSGEVKNRPNELLEAQDGKRLDTRTAGTAGAANQELATVGKIDRAN